MRFVDEFRAQAGVLRVAEHIRNITTRQWTLMEVCGGQTHSILRFGLDQLLPPEITLLHGPGCPVCVTPGEIIDQALAIASQPGVIFCSFGDMMRVPGNSRKDLFSVKAQGGDIRIVYSPLDAAKIAKDNPQQQVVFLAVGFETTAPANALAVEQAKQQGLKNFSILVSHVLVPPALISLMESPHNRINAFLAAGHVCTVMGYSEYEPIVQQYNVPIVVTGFEPLDILQGIYLCVKQLEEGRAEVENQYSRSVRKEGNEQAQSLISKVFEISNKDWRGLGTIQNSGLKLKQEYKEFDAQLKFSDISYTITQAPFCLSGEILTGRKKPLECSSFGRDCTPENPQGATMVSSEGACSAYYKYRRD